MSRVWVVATVVSLIGSGAAMASDAPRAGDLEPRYGPPGAWVKPLALPTPPAAPEGARAQALLLDAQDYFGPDGDEHYVEFAGKILTPDGLSALGSFTTEWNPDTERVTIHKLAIVRNGVVIDALATDKFIVLRRESNLEKAILDGRLTAATQISGLQVGDIVEFALTTTNRDPILQGHSETSSGLSRGFEPARERFRAAWPSTKAMRWRATGGLAGAVATNSSEGAEVIANLEGAAPPPPAPENAPARFKDAGRLEFSQFKSWSEVSSLLEPLFRQTSTLSPTSPLKAEAAKIKATTSDPELQAGLALRLVQDQVRYQFVGLNYGGYTPAAADLTWARRFGDCKGKTVLLLALLGELGIKAEPVMVNSSAGDGLDEHLPRLGVFDHVLVRALIGGRSYWLDGTLSADRDIRRIPQPAFGWGLPVRANGAELERLAGEPLIIPNVETVMTIDASSGLDTPHPVKVETVLHGGLGVVFSRKIGGMSRDEAQKAFLDSWTKSYGWVDVKTADWTYDATAAEFRFSMQGISKPGDWSADATTGARAFEMDNSSFAKIKPLERPAGQNADAPFAISFPLYERAVTELKLPGGGAGYAVLGENIDETINGVAYRRSTRLENGSVVMELSSRALVGEVSATQAKADNPRAKALEPQSLWVRSPAASDRTTTDPDTLVALGYNLIAEARPEDAGAFFDRALLVKPDFLPALVGRADSLSARGQVEAALADYDRALRLAPQLRTPLVIGRGAVLFAAGRYALAVEGYSAALAQTPDAGLLRARAEARAALGQFDLAMADADQAVKLAPDSPGALNLRGSLRLTRRETAAALEDFDHALRLDPDDLDNLLGRGAAYMALQQYDRAIADFDEARRINPAAITPWQARAGADAAAGRPDYAVRDLDHALELVPGSALLLNARCFARATGGLQLDLALADCDAALKLQPKSAAFLDSRGLARLRIGRFDEAIADYDAALALSPRLAGSLYGRGLAKLKKGDAAGGQADLAAAKAIMPGVEADFGRYGLKP